MKCYSKLLYNVRFDNMGRGLLQLEDKHYSLNQGYI